MRYKTALIIIIAAALAASTLSPALAGTEIEKIEWQVSLHQKSGKTLPFAAIKEWKQGPEDKTPGHLRILLTLANKGPRSIEGSVIRCAVSMRLVQAQSPRTSGVWGVPFWIEERRVPKIKPGQSLEVTIPHLDLQGYLKRLRGTGFWPEALKVQIMVEPRAGDVLSNNVQESVIPVTAG